MHALSLYRKKRYASGLALFFMCIQALAQQAYFQQEVNYKMQVRLDDGNHFLRANTEIQYINRSPQSLTFIYFHLWPNAYKNKQTALAKQLLILNKTDFHFSTPEERGFIDSLDFKINGQTVSCEYDTKNPDVCKLILNVPLKPSDTAFISTPFRVKIPDAKFSRLGHTKQSYYITQWYPKPAVYDNTGWHAMPYLDQGEFYSEFGSFDVSITLPSNYVLAATGDRIDAEKEEQFLQQKTEETARLLKREPFSQMPELEIPSSADYKTVRFKQTQVHDFAWFADKNFNVVKSSVTLPKSKRTVNTWVFFRNRNLWLWADAVNYVNRATLFYSNLNGEYPYNQVTAVDGTIMAGGGMEYPNITVIGNQSTPMDLDVTITHEVGHNWFYGMLGSNERDFPFMDEGINSYYELRYLRTYYPAVKLTEFIGADSTFKTGGLNKLPVWKEKEVSFLACHSWRTDQTTNQPAVKFSEVNYGSVVYNKTALALDYIADYLGEQTFDKTMHRYFEQYKFRHPSPQDFFHVLDSSSGSSAGLFEKYLFNTNARIDYAIKKVKRSENGSYLLNLKNKTGTVLPFNLYAYKNGEVVSKLAVEGFEKTKTVEVAAADIDYFKLDGLDKMPELNRRNNMIRAKGLLKKYKPIQLNFLTKLSNPSKTQLNFLPIAGVNFYNGFMPGIALHNYSFYKKRVEFLFAPMYAFNTLNPLGFAQIDLNLFPKKAIQQLTLGAKLKSFTYDYFNMKALNNTNGTSFRNLYFNFIKIKPYLQLELKKKEATSSITQCINLETNILITDSLNISGTAGKNIAIEGPVKKSSTSVVSQIEYQLGNKRAINPYTLTATVQQANTMAKAFVNFNYRFTIGPKHFFDVALFAGAFLSGTDEERGYYAFRPAGYTGYNDYLFEGNHAARNERNGLGFSQFMEKDGNLKAWHFLAQSPDWMTSVNLKSPKLGILPLKIFADIMVCDGKGQRNNNILWDAGINLVLWKDIVDVYVPLAFSDYIKTQHESLQIDFFGRIRFTVNIHKLVPKNFIHNNFP